MYQIACINDAEPYRLCIIIYKIYKFMQLFKIENYVSKLLIHNLNCSDNDLNKKQLKL